MKYEYCGKIYEYIDELMSAVRRELEENYTDCDYEDNLNERYGEVDIGGLEFNSGEIIRHFSPHAFYVGRNEYIDSIIQELECDMEEGNDTEYEVEYCYDLICIIKDEEETKE